MPDSPIPQVPRLGESCYTGSVGISHSTQWTIGHAKCHRWGMGMTTAISWVDASHDVVLTLTSTWISICQMFIQWHQHYAIVRRIYELLNKPCKLEIVLAWLQSSTITPAHLGLVLALIWNKPWLNCVKSLIFFEAFAIGITNSRFQSPFVFIECNPDESITLEINILVRN